MNDGKEKTPSEEFAHAVRQAWVHPEVPEFLDRAILVQSEAQANYYRLRRMRAPRRRLAACAVALVGVCACCGIYLNRHRDRLAAEAVVGDPAVDQLVNQVVEQQTQVAEQPVRRSRRAPRDIWEDFDNKLLYLESDVAMARSAEIRGNFNQQY